MSGERLCATGQPTTPRRVNVFAALGPRSPALANVGAGLPYTGVERHRLRQGRSALGWRVAPAPGPRCLVARDVSLELLVARLEHHCAVPANLDHEVQVVGLGRVGGGPDGRKP